MSKIKYFILRIYYFIIGKKWPTYTLNEVITETLKARSGRLAENITESSALVKRLKDRANNA